MVDEQKAKIDSEDEIEKRKPKPFRYITNLDELNNENAIEQTTKTVMTDENSTSEHLIKHFESAIGVGDIDIVEQVIKKHKNKRENDKDVGFV
jgi:hypothetical protein